MQLQTCAAGAPLHHCLLFVENCVGLAYAAANAVAAVLLLQQLLWLTFLRSIAPWVKLHFEPACQARPFLRPLTHKCFLVCWRVKCDTVGKHTLLVWLRQPARVDSRKHQE